MVEVAVLGARGYLGRTLVGLLWSHPAIDAVHPVSSRAAGTAYGEAVPALSHVTTPMVGPGDEQALGAEVAMLATPGGVAKKLVPTLVEAGVGTIVDLSRDHRQQALEQVQGWTYGLPELFPVEAGHQLIAGPGCYPTATLLSLAPALKAGMGGAGPLISDGKSGVSGAGATPRPDLHFPETNESLRAYKVTGHDHTLEIQAAIDALEAGTMPARPVRFTPHLVPQNRGLLTTAYLPLAKEVSQEEVEPVYQDAYGGEPFVRVSGEPDTGHVRGTNLADVAVTVDDAAGLLVARCAIDNLVKGGAGSAVQAMNHSLGLPPTSGLPTVGVGP